MVMGYSTKPRGYISLNTRDLRLPPLLKGRIPILFIGSYALYFERLVLRFSQVLKQFPATVGIT